MTYRNAIVAALLALAALAPAPQSIAGGVAKPQPADKGAAIVNLLPADLFDATWQWTWFGSGAEQFDVDHPERYTLQFSADGHLAIRADCNRGMGRFIVGADRQISISPIGKTMMLCPEGSLDGRFVRALERVNTWFEKDGDFFLESPLGSGTLRFRRQATD